MGRGAPPGVAPSPGAAACADLPEEERSHLEGLPRMGPAPGLPGVRLPPPSAEVLRHAQHRNLRVLPGNRGRARQIGYPHCTAGKSHPQPERSGVVARFFHFHGSGKNLKKFQKYPNVFAFK